MPRRALRSATSTRAASSVDWAPSSLPDHDSSYNSNIQLLRRNWKWAAFNQFFYTFAPIFAMPDVTIADIEDDLARSTSLHLPRVMQRLLVSLTQDRKINLDNWQTSLRKQYMKRAPDLNPLGPDPAMVSRKSEDVEPKTRESTAEQKNATDADAEATNPQQSTNVKHEDEDLPEEKPKDWLELPVLEKLDSMHLLTEWQFQNPLRVRSIMKDDDEAANWRIEPIGYDAKSNAYWLIGPDRLWIQRSPPKPPRPAKRKRQPAPKNSAKVKKTPAAKRRAVEETEDSEPEEASPAKRTRGRQSQTTRTGPSRASSPPLINGNRSRAAKVQANKKLDIQAKELAEFQRQAAEAAKAASKSPKKRGVAAAASQPAATPRPPPGTRSSARLRRTRGADEDDEWQEVPEEWLQETASPSPAPRNVRNTRSARNIRQPPATRKGKEKAVESDDDDADADGREDVNGAVDDSLSELTDLSDESVDEAQVEQPQEVQDSAPPSADESPKRATDKEANGADTIHTESTANIPSDFVEWEAICVTLEEWEHVADQFEKATHYLEKALYKMLTVHIVPVVTEQLREIERKRKLEEAIVHRKRSSRIAMKEVEKEEARLAAKRKAEEEEKEARARRHEARMKKEEAEREKREKAREQRRLEREERERKAQEEEERKAASSSRRRQSSTGRKDEPATSHSSADVLPRVERKSSDWMLNCEVCHKRGANLDGNLDLVSCGSCSQWHHIACHDYADISAGRPRRNWDTQPFICAECRLRRANPNGYPQQSTWPSRVQMHPSTAAYKLPAVDQVPLLPMSDVRMSPAVTANQSYSRYPPSSSYSQHPYQSGFSTTSVTPDARSYSTYPPINSTSSTNPGYRPPQSAYIAQGNASYHESSVPTWQQTKPYPPVLHSTQLRPQETVPYSYPEGYPRASGMYSNTSYTSYQRYPA